jgi:hypothetical protein
LLASVAHAGAADACVFEILNGEPLAPLEHLDPRVITAAREMSRR